MRRRNAIFALAVALCAATSATAQIRLGAPFGDHMVLQRDTPILIWGTGCPGGDSVKVAIAGQSVTARSDWQGHWQVQLAPMKAGGPYQMLIEVGGGGRLVPSPAANARGGAELNDVLVGDVISIPAAKSSAAADSSSPATGPQGTHPYALVRVFKLDARRPGASAVSPTARWIFVFQQTVPTGSWALFEAGRDAQGQRKVPVGVIEMAADSTCASGSNCAAAPGRAAP